jgi:hypothetical protein
LPISGPFILVTTCSPASRSPPPSSRPASHQTITGYLQGATLQEHRQTVCNRGKQTLASIFLTLNLLAFHTAAHLAVLAWRETVAACGATCRFFEHLRTITAYVVFQDWPHLLQSIAAAAIRPP